MTATDELTSGQHRSMGRARIRLAYLVSHPIQYQAPLLRLLAREPNVDLKVFFLTGMGSEEYSDPGFGRAITWDVPLLEGYTYEILATKDRFGQPKVWSFDSIEKRLRGQFDVLWVHGYGYLTKIRAMKLARRLGIKVLFRGESNLHTLRPGHPKQIIKDQFLRWCLNLCDGLLCIGTLNRQFYQHYGVSEDRLFDVPYAVDNQFFRKKLDEVRPQRESFRQSLGMTPGRPVILFTGKLLPHKRPMDVLDAYRKLAPGPGQEPLPYLLYVGDGEERNRLEERARQTGWNTIHFAGFQNQTELPKFFDLCDVFVLPSTFEPWGLIVNEVMNAGKPVVVSESAGCAPDLVRHGENGLWFPPGDSTALAGALKHVLSDPGRMREMGARSLERISRWGFREDINGFLKAADQVLSKK